MNEEELGEALRREIPTPKTGYWDEIDRRLAAAAQDATAGASDDGKDSGIGDTDASVIRLTHMEDTQATKTSASQKTWLLAAAAALVMIVGVGIGVLVNDDDSTPLNTAGGDEPPTSDAAPSGDTEPSVVESDDPTSLPGPTVPVTEATGNEPGSFGNPDGHSEDPGPATQPNPDFVIESGRHCYSGEETANVTLSLIVLADGTFTGSSKLDSSGVSYSSIEGRIVDQKDGRAEVVETFVSSTSESIAQDEGIEIGEPVTSEWLITRDVLHFEGEAFVESIDCDAIVDELVSIGNAIDQATSGVPSETN